MVLAILPVECGIWKWNDSNEVLWQERKSQRNALLDIGQSSQSSVRHGMDH